MSVGFSTIEVSKLFLIIQIILLVCLQMVFCSSSGEEIIFINGKVWTGNDQKPTANAVVVSENKIVFVVYFLFAAGLA